MQEQGTSLQASAVSAVLCEERVGYTVVPVLRLLTLCDGLVVHGQRPVATRTQLDVEGRGRSRLVVLRRVDSHLWVKFRPIAPSDTCPTHRRRTQGDGTQHVGDEQLVRRNDEDRNLAGHDVVDDAGNWAADQDHSLRWGWPSTTFPVIRLFRTEDGRRPPS
ncbi:hypothetical protein Purlil1_8238 [Purpureocillium lilacinum]|uniref:Secreted protein n=1 Tax=Purpureocillium lilacinum TaxID=33203 RepID=A0ABR0BTT2_PURLI|nr:hypothetical protein Purlil1_8238 [Purpureocillium lilacinum]